MEQIGTIAGRIVTQASQALSPHAQSASSQREQPKPRHRARPLKTAWQQQHLDLELTHPDVQTLADMAEQFAMAWVKAEAPRLVVVHGTTGSGKTAVARKLYSYARMAQHFAFERFWRGDRIPGLHWVNWLNVSSPETCAHNTFAEVLRDIEDASLVFVDDIGTETDQFRSGVPTRRLCDVLNRLQNKFAWVTTNIDPSAWATTWDVRTEDRLLAARIVGMTAPSFRPEKGE